MKKVLFILIMVVASKVYCQKHFIGEKIGLSATNAKGINKFPNTNARYGVNFSFTYDYFINESFSIGADIFYNIKGFTMYTNFTDELGNPPDKLLPTKYNYDYISLPIKMGYKFGNKAYFFSNIGIIPGLLVAAKIKFPDLDFNGVTTTGKTYNSIKEVNKRDLSGFLEIGGGYKFSKYLSIYSSIGYQRSFTTISNAMYWPINKIKLNGANWNFGIKYSVITKGKKV